MRRKPNRLMQFFDNDGKFLWAWGGKTVLDTLFQRPLGIAFDGNVCLVGRS